MDSAAKAAFIASQCACMQARLIAMQEQNLIDREAGRPLSFTPSEFEDLPNRFGLGHNDVITYLREG